jgi:hypothetical protein
MSTLSLQKPVAFLGTTLSPSACFPAYHRNFSSVFNDFGPKFTCVDPTGEQPLSGMIVSVEKVCTMFISLFAVLTLML